MLRLIQRSRVRSATSGRIAQSGRINLTGRHRLIHTKTAVPNPATAPKWLAVVFAGTILSTGLGIRTQTLYSDEQKALTRKDEASGVEFPLTLTPDSAGTKLTLVGLGVRTVSFLGLQVYSVGLYVDTSRLPKSKSNTSLSTEERIADIVRQNTCALRIVPVRNTSYSHLRDGFVRAIQARMSLGRKNGTVTSEMEEKLESSVMQLKAVFPTTSIKKHVPLDVVFLPSQETLTFEGLGEVKDGWLGRELFLAYFEGAGISPAMKQSVEDWLGARLA